MPVKKPLSRLRWWIGGLLFCSTVINYLDRQTLGVLAPFITKDYRLTNADFAWILIAFRVAYAGGQTIAGRVMDRLGTRKGLSATVTFYSVAAIFGSLATGLRSFCLFRFLLGLGESANWPGAAKAVAEWFPVEESGWAVALFDSGSSVGGALAPVIVLGAYDAFGSWRPVFALVGLLGFLWLAAFRLIYRRPEDHPRLSEAERELILTRRADAGRPAGRPLSYRTLLSLPQTWGIMLGKGLTDPVWFFVTDWFALYLTSRHFRLEDSLLAFWIPFLAADVGNFSAGAVSSRLIARGWSVGAARKTVTAVSGIGMMAIIPAIFCGTLGGLTTCFAVATFSYAALSTMILNLPADLYPRHSVASVSGLSGTMAGIGTIAATYFTGREADAHSFAPVLVAAGLVPLAAVALVLALVRNTGATAEGTVNRI